MGELWRDLVELLRRHPLLWLPVLIADLLGYLVNLGRNGLVRLAVLQASAQQSALGGSVTHGALTPAAFQKTTILALLLTWLSYFLRALLYSAALLATAALVQAFRERHPKPISSIAPAWGMRWGSLVELTLRALAVYAVAALLVSWLTPALAHHGSARLLGNPWFGSLLSLLLLAVLAVSLPPAAVRAIAGKPVPEALARQSQLLALMLAVVVSLFAAFVNTNAREMAQVPPGVRYPLEIIGSLVVALPYVFLFVGLSVLARKTDVVAEDALS